MSTPLGGGYIIFAFSAVRRPMSGVTHGFRSFKGKVLELSLSFAHRVILKYSYFQYPLVSVHLSQNN